MPTCTQPNSGPVPETLVLGGVVHISLAGSPPAPHPCALQRCRRVRAATGLCGSLPTPTASHRLLGLVGKGLGQLKMHRVGWALGVLAPRPYPASLHLPAGSDNATRVLLVHHGLQTALRGDVHPAPAVAWLLLRVSLKGDEANCCCFQRTNKSMQMLCKYYANIKQRSSGGSNTLLTPGQQGAEDLCQSSLSEDPLGTAAHPSPGDPGSSWAPQEQWAQAHLLRTPTLM